MTHRGANLIFAALCLVAPARARAEAPPVRAITSGPKFHWFAYYDKLQFDPTGRYVLSMEVDFEHRSPRADDVINPSPPGHRRTVTRNQISYQFFTILD